MQAFVYDEGRRLDMPGGSVALISPGIADAIRISLASADDAIRERLSQIVERLEQIGTKV